MKTKIGEKENKPKVHGLKGLLKAYPGAAVLAGLVLVGGVGASAMAWSGNNADEQVLSNDTTIVEELDESTASETKENSEVKSEESTTTEENKEEESSEENNITEELLQASETISTAAMTNAASPVVLSLLENMEGDTVVASTTEGGTESTASGEAGTTTTTTTTESTSGTTASTSTPLTSTENVASSATSLAAKAKQYKTSINSDIIGWLYIPNTGVNYPVTHTTNNTYYMNHNIYKQSDSNGALVADYECNFNTGLPTNTVIYGHNWHNYLAPLADTNPNDSMFDEVHKYADATFASNHPYIYFSTTEKNYKYQVFAAFYTNISWTDYLYTYPNATKLSNIISTAKNNSVHNFGVSATTSDKIISLSTCTRMMGNTNQYRFVVMAKLVG